MSGFLLTETSVLDKAFLSYRRTAEYVPAAPASVVDPVEEYVTATAGYAARFDGLTGDTLRRVEETQDTDAANDRVGGPRCLSWTRGGQRSAQVVPQVPASTRRH